MSVIINPIEQYFDLNGDPLENGYLYFGELFGNPVTQPVMVYFDPEFTIPAAQPVRTVNGYPVRSGTATGLFSPEDVSILIQNNKKEQVLYVESSNINVSQNTTFYRDSDTTLNADDNNKTFILLNPFNQTFDAAVNLGDRWRVNLINMSNGNITLDPNLSETIDGLASLQLQPNKMLTVYCDGVNLETTTFTYPSRSILSASTLDLSAIPCKVITITGANTINAISMINGDKFTAIISGTPTFTNSASLIVQGGSNYAASPDDIVTISKDATSNNVYVTIDRATGNSAVNGIYAVTADVVMTSKQWGGIFESTSSSNWTVTIDSVTNNANKTVQFIADGTGSLTVARSGSSTFTVNGTALLASFTLRSGQSAKLICNGTNSIVQVYGDALYAEVVAANQTSIDFTGLQPWAKEHTLIMNSLSTNGTSQVQVQMGSGSVTTTGYVSNAGLLTNGSGTQASSVTTGFNMQSSGATAARTGNMIINKLIGFTWISSHNYGDSALAVCNGGGSITLSGNPDRIRITTVNGTDLIDAGSVSLVSR